MSSQTSDDPRNVSGIQNSFSYPIIMMFNQDARWPLTNRRKSAGLWRTATMMATRHRPDDIVIKQNLRSRSQTFWMASYHIQFGNWQITFPHSGPIILNHIIIWFPWYCGDCAPSKGLAGKPRNQPIDVDPLYVKFDFSQQVNIIEGTEICWTLTYTSDSMTTNRS